MTRLSDAVKSGSRKGKVLFALAAVLLPLSSYAQTVANSPASDEGVLAWGRNSERQLGPHASGEFNSSAVEVSGLEQDGYRVIQVAAGGEQSFALLADSGADRRVFGWGQSPPGHVVVASPGTDTGVLGVDANGNPNPQGHNPVELHGLGNVQQLESGFNYALALNADGTVLAWGDNGCGQLGDPDGVKEISPGATFPVSLLRRATPRQVKGLTDIVEISAGWTHALALKRDGSLWGWGNNSSGQLGNGAMVSPTYADGCATERTVSNMGARQDEPTPVRLPPEAGRVIALDAGMSHSLAVTADGKLWAWGNNCWGQVGATETANVPVNIPVPKEVQRPMGGDGKALSVNSVSAGGRHSVLLTEGGEVYSWGSAQLTGKGSASGVTPSACPRGYDFGFGRLLFVFQFPDHHPEAATTGGLSLQVQPVPVKSAFPANAATITSIDAGGTFSLARDAAGQVFSWGRNEAGQLGYADPATPAARTGLALSPRLVPLDEPVLALSASFQHTLARFGESEVDPPMLPGAQPSPSPSGSGSRLPFPTVPGIEKVSTPRVELPEPGTGGGVFITGHSDLSSAISNRACTAALPQTTCNTEGARYFVRRAVSFVTPGTSGPRLLYIKGLGAHELKGSGYTRGCPADQSAPVAPPGCFDTSWDKPGEDYAAAVDCRDGCPSDWRPDNYVDTVDFRAYDAVLIDNLPPYTFINDEDYPCDGHVTRAVNTGSEYCEGSRQRLIRRREELVDYANNGGGLVFFHTAAISDYPDRDGCRPPDESSANPSCRGGIFQFLTFLEDRFYHFPDETTQFQLSPTDFFSVTEPGRRLGLSDGDVNEHKARRPGSWFRESCGFEVFEVDKFRRITSMGTRKRIPDETKCSGVTAQHASVMEGHSGTRALTFEVSLNSVRSPGADGSSQETIQRVHFETVDGSATTADNDYLPTEGTLEFSTTPGAPGSGPQRVTVEVAGDTRVETDETINLHLTGEGVSSFEQTVVGTIINDDGLPDGGPTGAPGGAPLGDQVGQTGSLTQPGGNAATSAAGPAPGPAAAPAQAVAQAQASVQAPGPQAQAQGQGQAQVQAQSSAHAPQVGVMEEKQKQEEIQRAYLDNDLIPAELLASQRPSSPVVPLAVMVFSVLSALGLNRIRGSTSATTAGEKVPGEDEEEDLALPMWLRRKRLQR